MTAVDRTQLGVGPELARGGQGAVFAVADPTMVFKEYFPHIHPEVDYDVLADLPAAFTALSVRVRSRLAYPARLVTGPAGPSGFVMPRIPHRYALPNGKDLSLQHLLNGPDFAVTRLGIAPYDLQAVYLLLADLAGTLAELHAAGIAVGDVSPKNTLVSFHPQPTAFLIDCDSMVVHGRQALPPVTTPDWTAPESATAPTPTVDSDAYKFGLVVLRLITGDQQFTDPARLPHTVPEVLRRLTTRALSPDPATRGPVADWIGPLTAAATTAAGVPLGPVTPRPSGPVPVQAPVGRHHVTPGPAPAAAGSGAAGRRSLSTPAIWSWIGAACLLTMLVVAVITGRPDDASPARAARSSTTATSTTDHPAYTTTTRPTTTTTTPRTTTQAPRTTTPSRARSLPSDLRSCPDAQTPWTYRPSPTTSYVPLSVGVGATTPATHCNFAMETARAFGTGSGSLDGQTRSVVSPNTGKSYPMTCRSVSSTDIVLRCHDGATAVVYFYY